MNGMDHTRVTNHSTISEDEREAALRWLEALTEGVRYASASAENIAVAAFRTHGPRNQQQSKAA